MHQLDTLFLVGPVGCRVDFDGAFVVLVGHTRVGGAVVGLVRAEARRAEPVGRQPRADLGLREEVAARDLARFWVHLENALEDRVEARSCRNERLEVEHAVLGLANQLVRLDAHAALVGAEVGERALEESGRRKLAPRIPHERRPLVEINKLVEPTGNGLFAALGHLGLREQLLDKRPS